MRQFRFVRSSLLVFVALAALVDVAAGQTVWSGLTHTFSHPANSSIQDDLTPNVSLTRSGTRGLFNSASEPDYLSGTSPEHTMWATELNNPGTTVTATNWSNLVFQDWQTSYGGSGALSGNIVGMDTVVYLVLDEIYLDLKFTTWGVGTAGGGAFSYQRAEPPTVEPTGDYNGDLIVDAADYTVWRDTLGQSVAAPGDGADGDLSGEIDAPDYTLWKDRFGDAVTPGSASASVVPEPTTVAALIGALVSLVAGVRKRSFSTIRFNFTAPLAAFVAIAFVAAPAHALFHLWDFTELFSLADGSVQFIEMRTTSNGENVATAGQLRSQSTGNVFIFPNNLPSNQTANKSMLVATAGFAALPGGITPDFTLPANFFNPAGDTVSLFLSGFGTVDSRTFTALPSDGVNSRHYPSNTLAANSPTNFAGASGSINLAPPTTTGDYNGDLVVDAADYTVWRDALGTDVTAGSGADGDADGEVDLGDYDFWKDRFGDTVPPGAGSATAATVPEPTAVLLLLGGILGVALRASCDRRSRR
jgi:hypothetical protein